MRVGYSSGRQVEDAMAVLAGWIGKNYNVKVVYHDGHAVDADIFNGIIRIPRLACSSGITQEALMLLRGRVYHEAGHIGETHMSKSEYPKGKAMFSILNALEDRRMEAVLRSRFVGCEKVLNWQTDYYNKDIAKKMTEGKVDAPLWEALVAMSFMVESRRPAWSLSDKAKLYVDKAYDEFRKVKDCGSAMDCLGLAKVIHELLKEANEDKSQDKSQDKDDSSESGDNSESGEDGESGDNSEDSSGSGNSGDNSELDDECEEDSEGNSEGDLEEEDSESKGSSKNDCQAQSRASNDTGEYGDSDAELDLDAECDGYSIDEALNEAIVDALGEIDPRDASYTSCKDADEHMEVEASEYDKSIYKDNREDISAQVAEMSRALEQALRAMAKCRKNPYLRQGKIDSRRLVQISKGLSKEVFYKVKEGRKLEVAVEIIIDESGSMRNYRDVRLLAMAIGESLDRIGVPFEITGTTTKYTSSDSNMPRNTGFTRNNPIVYKHYKSFGEKWNAVNHRIVKTGKYNHNVDGEAIEYCAMRLANRPEARKVIFSLSDGRPDCGEGKYEELAHNLKRVCERSREHGIEVYGFGIGTNAPRAYYGKDYFVSLNAATDMGPAFMKKFVEVITKGEVRV